MRDLLVLSGGHPYEREPFAQLLASLGDWNVTHLMHPEAEQAVAGGQAQDADAVLFYDMGGYTFADNWVTSRPPSEAYRRAIVDRFKAGRGAVAMHHALAGWADWPEWHEMLGG
ncbi:ThuA domain-containing protein, partial [Erythrobacter sp. KMU-140]|nr:ThuA domain-containing protein [Erythrobacter rubeus]